MSFKIHFRCGNPPLCRGVKAVPSGPKSHTFTVILAVFTPQPRWRGLRYFAKRNETKRNGTLRNGTLRNGTLRNGTLRNGALRNGTLRNGTLRNGYTSANAPKFFVGDQILKISSLECFITLYL